MNIHTRNVTTQPDQNAVEEALDILRNWVGHADETEIASLDADLLAQVLPQQYPEFSASYNSDFTVNEAYRDSMPDLQNGPTALIRGAKQQIQHVGISNFRLPICYQTRNGSDQTLQTSVTGTVSLDADKKGINMSRIMRSFTAMLRKVLVLM